MSSSFPIPAVADHPTLRPEVLRGRVDGLCRTLETVTDPRKPRGVRYRLPLLLALAVLAVTAGAKTFTEIAKHATDLPVDILTELGVRSWSGTPSGWTFARVLAAIDHDELDHALSDGAARDPRPVSVAIDGKTMQAAATGQASMPRTQVVAAMNSHGQILGQTTVQAGNENAAARNLPARLGPRRLTGAVITADAKHTGAAFVSEIEALEALWLLPIKGNQPSLHTRLNTLPCTQARLDTRDRTRGHGRAETRSLKTLALDENMQADLLGARQAIRIRRWRRPKGQPPSIETVHYLTNLPPRTTSPAALAQLARGHWGIENRLHLVHDTAFDEDHHHARTGNAPQNLAVLRNTAITLHRSAGTTPIRPALRAHARRPKRLLDLLLETA